MTLERATAPILYPRFLGIGTPEALRLPQQPVVAVIAHRPTPWQVATAGGEQLKSRFRARVSQPSSNLPATDAPGGRTEKMARVEAALLVADRPLSLRKLAQHSTLVDADDARRQIEFLNAAYELDASPFQIEQVATGFQLLTRPEFAAWLDKRHHRPARMKLSPPAMETLTIVAYRQPVTRADVDAVRGVQAGEMLKQLMDRGLIRITGEDDTLGRPYLYGTTRQFLEHFGLQNLDDLPGSDELRAPDTAAAIAQADAGQDLESAEATPDNDESFEDVEGEAVESL